MTRIEVTLVITEDRTANLLTAAAMADGRRIARLGSLNLQIARKHPEIYAGWKQLLEQMVRSMMATAAAQVAPGKSFAISGPVDVSPHRMN